MIVRLAEAARDDLRRIRSDGAATFGPERAARYLRGMNGAFARLSDFPKIGRARRTDPEVRVLTYGSHVIIYLLEVDEILVLRVRHGREDWLRQLQDWTF